MAVVGLLRLRSVQWKGLRVVRLQGTSDLRATRSGQGDHCKGAETLSRAERIKAGRSDAIRELRQLFPIVTNEAIDDIEDRMIERWTRDKDRLWLHAVTALRSLRQESARWETAWLVVNATAARRFMAEIETLKHALDIALTEEKPRRPLVRTIRPAPSKESLNGQPTRDAQTAIAPTRTPGAASDQTAEPARPHAHTGGQIQGRQERGSQGQAGQSGAVRES